ncbi:MAG TPA: asparagine synthase (glutamine-hydrolyzing) [Nitrospira sp.]|nr:asparagine synthase (glutamine-hydrolyzing) [Nitrospira sp.]
MCGIFAVFQTDPVINWEVASRAADAMTHRGPDEKGEWRDRHAMLFHRRLSIIDLVMGRQPMVSKDGRHAMVFNGEIYNFSELRDELKRGGVIFTTQSDTEVLLEGFRRWGVGVVERLNGMFAFLVWDRFESRVFGARDRLGIKPLTWGMHKGALVIASTVEPFTALDEFRSIDPVAVRDVLTFDYIPAPRTILRNVYKLPPGCWLQWRLGDASPQIEHYWRPPLADQTATTPCEAEIEELLHRAVKRQLVSDVPVGAFLSGGIDSSLIVALMARESSRPVKSFSVAFDEEEFDESPLAQLVANEFGTDHTVLRGDSLSAEGLLDLLGRLDEPFADPAVIPTCALAKLTAGHVKVALSGDGGDEVFGGYSKYLVRREPRPLPGHFMLDAALRTTMWRPRGMANIYQRTLSSRDQLRWSRVRYGDFPVFRKDLRQVLSVPHHDRADIPSYFEPWDRVAGRYGHNATMDSLMRTDLETYLSENCLVKTDRASMLASLEVRVPYLDELLLDRFLPLPAEKKIVDGTLKALLKPLAKRLLPRQVWDRPKHGFNAPVSRLLARQWRPAMESVLEWGRGNVTLFDYDYLERLHEINCAEGGIDRELWNPFVTLTWMMRHSLRVS